MTVTLVSVANLRNYERSYDFFTAGNEPDVELIGRGYHPPLPVRQAPRGGQYGQLLWGWRVVAVAERLSVQQLPVIDFEGSNADAIATALALEARQGSYTFEERAAVYRRALAEGLSDSDIARIGRAVVSDGSFAATTVRYVALPPLLQKAVNGGLVDLKSAEYVRRLPEPFLRKMLDSEAFTLLSFSKRRLVSRLFRELYAREPDAAEQTLDEYFVKSEVFGGPSAVLQPISLERRLFELRYPELTRLEQRFDKIETQIRKRTGFRMEAPEHFEGGAFRIEFSFGSRAELEQRASDIEVIGEHCDELFSLLR